MKRLGMMIATGVLAFTACSGDAEEQPDTTGEPAEVVDAVSGRPLSEFEGSPSYDVRAAITESADELLERMEGVAAHLDDGDFSDIVSTCEDLTAKKPDADIVTNAVTRFSGGPGEEIDAAQAQALIELSKKYACP